MTGNLPINLHDLLRQRTIEGERVEYKAGWNPQSVLHTICAFANDFHNLGGGYVVLGVEERDGQPLLPPRGIDPGRIDAVQNELLRLGQSAMQPHYHPLTGVYEVEGRTILVLWAPGGETRPYKARVSLARGGTEWAYYIRLYSSTVRARGADERELLSLAATVPFDDRYHQSSSLDDLSPRLIERFLRDVGSDLAEETGLPTETLGRRMNIVGGPAEACFPKNVGLLFFNEGPHRFFPATQIDVVWFPDGAGGDRFEEKEFRGPLSVILRDTIDFIGRNYLKETVVKHPHQAEAERFWNFPLAAIEEAVVNAIYHRSYEEREPVEVRITPQELTILSFPGANRSIRMEDLQMGRAISRRYRNRRIGEFLKELDLAEGRSTGIPKILRAMHGNGSPAPLFESDDDRTWFLTRLPVHEQARSEPSGQVTPQATPQVTPQVKQLVAALAGEMSRSQMQATIGIRDRNYFTTAYLRPALEAGLIEMRLPDKATSGNQRYRRTAAGKALVQEVEPTPQVTPQDTPQVTGHVRQLVAALTGAMSGARLQEALRLRDRNHFTNTYLRPALEAGLVEMTLPDKPTSRNQRYRLTAAGEALPQHTGAKDASP
ncbi:MAG: putative DNA binding domain-containing protein [Bryobacterales bacterium]|nr:putative DNA binding domain-containing protein [Spirochaetaceae bacterium]MDE0432568.1 putative DNA binding domain-containing protein [Bryobacterales bacterium]